MNKKNNKVKIGTGKIVKATSSYETDKILNILNDVHSNQIIPSITFDNVKEEEQHYQEIIAKCVNDILLGKE